MKLLTLGLCTVVALLAIACNQGTETANTNRPATAPSPTASTATATPDELAAARANYQKNCVACHGETGEGGPVTVEGKRLKVPSFKAAHALKDSDEDFVSQINKGGDGMPSFKDKLSAQEIGDLVKMIRKHFQGK